MSEPAWSPVKPVTPEVKDICFKVRPDIEKMAGAHFKIYIPLSFASQIVLEGTNYVVKVDIGGDECVHAMISAVLSVDELTYTVLRIQHPKTRSDPLVPF